MQESFGESSRANKPHQPNPRFKRSVRKKQKRQSSKKTFQEYTGDEYSNPDTLAQEKIQLVEEIAALRDECFKYQDQLKKLEAKDEIETEQPTQVYRRRTLSTQVEDLRAELQGLENDIQYLSSNFSETNENVLRMEVIIKSKKVAQAHEEYHEALQNLLYIQQKAESQELLEVKKIFDEQLQLKQKLRDDLQFEKRKEKEIQKEIDSHSPHYEQIVELEADLLLLNKRLRYLQHIKQTRIFEKQEVEKQCEIQRRALQEAQKKEEKEKAEREERARFRKKSAGKFGYRGYYSSYSANLAAQSTNRTTAEQKPPLSEKSSSQPIDDKDASSSEKICSSDDEKSVEEVKTEDELEVIEFESSSDNHQVKSRDILPDSQDQIEKVAVALISSSDNEKNSDITDATENQEEGKQTEIEKAAEALVSSSSDDDDDDEKNTDADEAPENINQEEKQSNLERAANTLVSSSSEDEKNSDITGKQTEIEKVAENNAFETNSKANIGEDEVPENINQQEGKPTAFERVAVALVSSSDDEKSIRPRDIPNGNNVNAEQMIFDEKSNDVLSSSDDSKIEEIHPQTGETKLEITLSKLIDDNNEESKTSSHAEIMETDTQSRGIFFETQNDTIDKPADNIEITPTKLETVFNKLILEDHEEDFDDENKAQTKNTSEEINQSTPKVSNQTENEEEPKLILPSEQQNMNKEIAQEELNLQAIGNEESNNENQQKEEIDDEFGSSVDEEIISEESIEVISDNSDNE